MGLELIPAYGRQEEIMTLFTEYTDMLMEADPTVRQYLILQHYEKELERPESKYGMPEGRLYLGRPSGGLHRPAEAGRGARRAEAAVRPVGLPGPPDR